MGRNLVGPTRSVAQLAQTPALLESALRSGNPEAAMRQADAQDPLLSEEKGRVKGFRDFFHVSQFPNVLRS